MGNIIWSIIVVVLFVFMITLDWMIEFYIQYTSTDNKLNSILTTIITNIIIINFIIIYAILEYIIVI